MVHIDTQIVKVLRANQKNAKERQMQSHRACETEPVEGFATWRFMGSYKWGYKSPNIGYNQSYPTYNPTNNYP